MRPTLKPSCALRISQLWIDVCLSKFVDDTHMYVGGFYLAHMQFPARHVLHLVQVF